MKYGLIVNLRTQNIGDDIQSYAMEKFLPHTDYLIDREHLDNFYTKTGEKVAALLGGWYLHKALNWPPSPFLKLLPISFHITTIEAKKFLTFVDYGASWLKKIEPIGCRDRGTMEELKRLNIAAYTSGCFTLTIRPLKNVEKHGKIVLTDLSDELVKFIQRRAATDTVFVSHDVKKPLLPKEAVAFARNFKHEDDLPTSHFPAQHDRAYHGNLYGGNWAYRRAVVEGLLRFYQGASLVVTGRLHAALPAVALGTPVLMIKSAADMKNYRFSTFLPYLNCTTPEDLLSRKFSYDFDEPIIPPPNEGYKELAEGIRAKCIDFITECETAEPDPPLDVELWREVHRRNMRLKRIMKMLIGGGIVKGGVEEPLDPNLLNPALYNF